MMGLGIQLLRSVRESARVKKSLEVHFYSALRWVMAFCVLRTGKILQIVDSWSTKCTFGIIPNLDTRLE
jgi:hypothetical protein